MINLYGLQLICTLSPSFSRFTQRMEVKSSSVDGQRSPSGREKKIHWVVSFLATNVDCTNNWILTKNKINQ